MLLKHRALPAGSPRAKPKSAWITIPLYAPTPTERLKKLAFSEPEKSQKQIKDIVESAYDHGAEMIVTPCPLCQANVEIYQGAVNKRYGTKFNIPVLYTAN